MAEKKDKSTTSLVALILTQLSGLLRHEIDLARAEMSEGMSAAMRGLALILVGIVLSLTALDVLAAAAVAALVEWGLDPFWSALIIGGVILALAIFIVARGARLVRAGSLAPKRAAQRMRRSTGLVRETTE